MTASTVKTTALRWRYAIMSLHIIIWIACFLLTLFLTGDGILWIVLAASGLALLIYVPAALILSLRDSASGFSSAGGEVGYVSVQIALWTASTILAIVGRALSDCASGFADSRVFYGFIVVACNTVLAVGIISIVHLVILGIWLTILITRARHTPGKTSSEAFRIPAHRLLAGPVWSERGGNVFGIEAGEADHTELFNPYASRGAIVEPFPHTRNEGGALLSKEGRFDNGNHGNDYLALPRQFRSGSPVSTAPSYSTQPRPLLQAYHSDQSRASSPESRVEAGGYGASYAA